jgi:hypothetical protein
MHRLGDRRAGDGATGDAVAWNGRVDRPIFGLLWRANEAVLPVIQPLWILNARDERWRPSSWQFSTGYWPTFWRMCRCVSTPVVPAKAGPSECRCFSENDAVRPAISETFQNRCGVLGSRVGVDGGMGEESWRTIQKPSPVFQGRSGRKNPPAGAGERLSFSALSLRESRLSVKAHQGERLSFSALSLRESRLSVKAHQGERLSFSALSLRESRLSVRAHSFLCWSFAVKAHSVLAGGLLRLRFAMTRLAARGIRSCSAKRRR